MVTSLRIVFSNYWIAGVITNGGRCGGQGTRQSRSAIPMDAFAHKMDASPWRLACCDKRLRSLQITPISSQRVVVSATLLFETKRPRPKEQSYPTTLNFYLEEEQWLVDLSGVSQP